MEQDQTRPLVLVVEQSTFPLGFIAVTSGALERLRPSDIEKGLERHSRCDWGELTEEERDSNERRVRRNAGAMSVYRGGDDAGRFYVITDPGHAITTILMPDEY